jgi:molecular chaperone GrpE
MDPEREIEDLERFADETETADSISVEDFIKELEAKEKDLHITADTTLIEIAEGFGDEELPDFLQTELSNASDKAIEIAPRQPALEPPDRGAELECEIDGLKDKIVRLQTEREELLQLAQRRAKDFENFKARTERERSETFQLQLGNLATQMLPALDNLDRAVGFAESHSDKQNSAFQQFLDGIVLVNQQVNEVLAGMGVQPIATVGEAFDPHYHEAVATEESDEFPPNTISAELLRGYRIGERVIRHSMVKVTTASTNIRNEHDAIDSEKSEDDLAEDSYLAEPENHLPADHESELSGLSPAGDE